MEDKLTQLIELQQATNTMLAQLNASMLFIIGSASAIIVCLILYKAIKKFI